MILSALTIAAPAVCFAQRVSVQSADSVRPEIVAPKILTRAFVVSNLSNARLQIAERIVLPEGWQPLIQDTLFSLAPAAKDLRLMAISVPLQAPPGRYKVIYLVQDYGDSSSTASAETDVLVLPIFKLDVIARETPRRVIAGEDYMAQFEVTSRCNSACTVTAQVLSTNNLPVVLSDTAWLAQPGQSKVFTAIVRTNPRVITSFKHRLTLRISVSDPDAHRREATAHCTVDVIPRSVAGGDFYHRVPSVIATRYVSEQGHSGLQMEYSGTGSLDTRGAYKVAYLLRGPRDLEQNVFGLRDEYYVALENRSGEARVGDLSFSLSPLMEQNRMGRGAKAMLRTGSLRAGGYTFKMRPKYPDLDESAGFVGYSPSPRLDLRINCLSKRSRTLSGNLLGMSTGIVPLRNMNLDLDYSADVNGRRVSRQNSAVFARFTGGVGALRLSLERVYAGRHFQGYYHDEDQKSVSASVPVLASLQYHAAYRSLAQNLSRSPSRLTALSEDDIQTGLSCTFPFRTGASLDVEKLSRVDELAHTDLDYRERSATLRLRHAFRALNVTASVKRGLWDNPRLHAAGDMERYGIGVNVAPDVYQSYCISFQTGNSSLGNAAHMSRTLSAASSFRIAQRLTLGVSFQASDFKDPSAFENDQFAADLRCEVYKGQTLSLRARKVNYALQIGMSNGFSWMAAYEIPIGMPVSKQNTVGCVKGRIYDEEDAHHAGMASVVLRLDDLTALTDNKGNFVFPSVAPGLHYLQVDNASIGLHRVMTRRVPVEIQVRGGRTEIFTCGVVRSGSVKGQMALFTRGGNSSRGYLVEADSLSAPSNEAQTLQLKSGLANVEIQMCSADQTIRTITDRDGNFQFSELRPGRWRLLIPKESLPPFHRVERDTYEAFVQPGENETLDVRVIPRTRSLIIVDEGKVPISTTSRK